MIKHVGIFGTSGFAREAGDIAFELGLKPIFIARDQSEMEACTFPSDVIQESDIDRIGDMGFAIGIGENVIRQKIFQRFSGKLRFVSLIHPSASFGWQQRQRIEEKQGVIVCAGVRFTNSIKVGDFTIFNLNVTVGHDAIVEDFVNIAPGACISGNVHIESRCLIGTGAVVNQGLCNNKLRIGAGTVIGSGSVVVKACEPNAVYVGIPAKRIK